MSSADLPPAAPGPSGASPSVPAHEQPRASLRPLWLALGGIGIAIVAFIGGAGAATGVFIVTHGWHQSADRSGFDERFGDRFQDRFQDRFDDRDGDRDGDRGFGDRGLPDRPGQPDEQGGS